MHSSLSLKQLIRLIAPMALLMAFLYPRHVTGQAMAPASSGEDHIVNAQALQQVVVSAAAAREKNIETLTEMLRTPTAQKAMHDAKVDPAQVKNAIPTLSDDELANLSGRVTKAQSDFSAGILGIGFFTLIILVVILIIVVAAVH